MLMYVQRTALERPLREPANVVSGDPMYVGVLEGGLMRYLFLVMNTPHAWKRSSNPLVSTSDN